MKRNRRLVSWQLPEFSSDPELNRRMAVAQNQRKGASERKLLHDPIEDDEAIKVLVELAGAKADSEIPSEPWSLGRCHAVWARMKKILKDEHGITWYSPQEMNPFVRFD